MSNGELGQQINRREDSCQTVLNSSEKVQCPVRKNSLFKNYSFIRTQIFSFSQRLQQLQSADVVEKKKYPGQEVHSPMA